MPRAVSRFPPNPVTLNETNILLRSCFRGSYVLLILRTLVPSIMVTDYFHKGLRKYNATIQFFRGLSEVFPFKILDPAGISVLPGRPGRLSPNWDPRLS